MCCGVVIILIPPFQNMFFITKLEHKVHVPPEAFHKQLGTIVRYQLCKEVEGTVDEDYGYIVSVDTSNEGIEVGPGVLLDTGVASFAVTYSAIVLRPMKNEIVDTIVSSVLTMGIICKMGPVEV